MENVVILSDLIRAVKVYLYYLFDEFSFTQIHAETYPQDYHNSLVVLQSHQCRARILLEKGQVSIEFGSLDSPINWSVHAPDQWFDVSDIIGYLNQRSLQPEIELINRIPDLSFVEQLRILSISLHSHIVDIVHIFTTEMFATEQSYLMGFRRKRTNQWLESLYQQRKP